MTENLQPQTETETDGWDWAVVEIFGHRSHAGRIREEERFGSKMLRIDVPKLTPLAPAADATADDASRFDLTWTTHYYGGSSIFGLTLTDEVSVMRANKPYESPYRARLPAPETLEPAGEFDDDDG